MSDEAIPTDRYLEFLIHTLGFPPEAAEQWIADLPTVASLEEAARQRQVDAPVLAGQYRYVAAIIQEIINLEPEG